MNWPPRNLLLRRSVRSSWARSLRSASEGAAGVVIILSPNPIEDTGGGQRSAQIAQELLSREYAVLFLSHGQITESVDLNLDLARPRLVALTLEEFSTKELTLALPSPDMLPCLVLTQVACREWLKHLRRLRKFGATTVYDLIDDWGSELGWGWFDPRIERRVVAHSDILLATAPRLVRKLEHLTSRRVHLSPNAYNHRLFSRHESLPQVDDVPSAAWTAIYVGALWGKWFDWDLIRESARANPEGSFVFIGDYRGECTNAPENCIFLGLRSQADLAAYLARADVALLPWHDSSVTQSTSPLKVFEYLSMGLPVLAPKLETLRGIPGVTYFSSREEFILKLPRLAKAPLTSSQRRAVTAFCDKNTWGQRVDHMLHFADLSPQLRGKRSFEP